MPSLLRNHPITISIIAFLLTYAYFSYTYLLSSDPDPDSESPSPTPPCALAAPLSTNTTIMSTVWAQTTITLPPKARGCYLITDHLLRDLQPLISPSAKLGLYRHDAEGYDDMPAHVKSALIGASVSVPVSNGKLALGTWQGIWYLEFRARVHTRKVVATVQGERMAGSS
ncbi:hypothetical protein BDZ91DRAFT_708575 [Kalaharituber pfeilii]|nr:hypothetical protein BDZ91DRAFT_708575 [Kalaharituber pfeilii]